MYTYALTLDLDIGIEAAIYEIWERLRAEGISDYGFAHEGKAPHITLADFKQIDMALMERELLTFSATHNALEVRMDQIGQFEGNRTVFITASECQPLFSLHTALLSEVKSTKLLKHSFCSEEKWRPHLTIASRLDAHKIEIVNQYIQEKLPLTGHAISISLLKLYENAQGRVIGQEVVRRFLLKR